MSNTFYVTKSPDDIQHYGVLGMKWGIRRYQNVNGSYTQKGLKRLNQTKQIYEQAKANRNNDNNSRLLYKKAKRQLKNDTNQVYTDYSADKGKELVNEKGKSIAKSILGGAGGLALAAAGFHYMKKTGRILNAADTLGWHKKSLGYKYYQTKLAMNMAAIPIGTTIFAKKMSDIDTIASYKFHTRNTDTLKKERQKMFGTSKK